MLGIISLTISSFILITFIILKLVFGMNFRLKNNMEKIKTIIKLAPRYGLLFLGIILTLASYFKIGVPYDFISWGIIFIFIGLLVAISRYPIFSMRFGFGKDLGSANGVGTTLYGKRDVESDGSYIATKWFIVFLLPIVPISSYRVLPNTPKLHFLMQITTYNRFEKVSFNKKQVINTYLLVYGFIFIIFVLPFLIFS